MLCVCVCVCVRASACVISDSLTDMFDVVYICKPVYDMGVINEQGEDFSNYTVL